MLLGVVPMEKHVRMSFEIKTLRAELAKGEKKEQESNTNRSHWQPRRNLTLRGVSSHF